MNYKDTLNLLQTKFPMKADLLNREPVMRAKWDENDIYARIREAREGSKKYTLHDGPPYATGDLHIGTGMNKVLKDFIVRYYTMLGCDAPYIPGWDCHGHPIEHRVMTELGEKSIGMTPMDIRRKCEKYATKFIERNRQEFKALGIFGDWYRPYLTLHPSYEAGVLDVFGKLVEQGYVYRSKKPVHWCASCETALAEAELEYADATSPSIFVRCPMVSNIKALYPEYKGEDAYIVIWTTTPWTIPANRAVAVHPDHKYAALRCRDAKSDRDIILIMAEELVETVTKKIGIADCENIGAVEGRKLESLKYKHPYLDRQQPIINADYVTLEDGTGCVHTAPGHGQEDYIAAQAYDLEVFSPVDDRGRFTAEAGEFEGVSVFDAADPICAKLTENGALLHRENVNHSYPHCWRCKRPVIFRATEQWFVSVDHKYLRKRAIEEVHKAEWIPDWSEQRISTMISGRPDWCISRQRFWGVPIPVFFCKNCDHALLDEKVVFNLRDIIREKGCDYWYSAETAELLPAGTKCPKCGSGEFEKGRDIFDVWFESGSSHRSVVIEKDELTFPADLYLEGTDQHRGWFQLSILPSVATQGCAPFKRCITHGFVVDEQARKMSKSMGNFVSIGDVIKNVGVDVFRLWISSIDYKDHIRASLDIVKGANEGYRKLRNTFRYLLSNLGDFDPQADAVPVENMLEIDRWALGELHALIEKVRAFYDEGLFYRVNQAVLNFCIVTMSSFYLDILKDRLYADGRESLSRRSAQTTMYHTLIALTKLLAPILVHTCEEVWSHIEHKDEDVPSVHLATMPQAQPGLIDAQVAERWETIVKVRSDIARELEKLRADKVIGSSLEANVFLYIENANLKKMLKTYAKDLPAIFIVSEVTLVDEPGDDFVKGENYSALSIKAVKSDDEKCQRCWNFRSSVGGDPEHPTLCSRCIEVVNSL